MDGSDIMIKYQLYDFYFQQCATQLLAIAFGAEPYICMNHLIFQNMMNILHDQISDLKYTL